MLELLKALMVPPSLDYFPFKLICQSSVCPTVSIISSSHDFISLDFFFYKFPSGRGSLQWVNSTLGQLKNKPLK